MEKQFIFGTKEQYLSMIDAWKEEFKKSRKLERNEYGNKIRKLNDTDFFLYAILRGKDPRRCYHSEFRFEEALGEMEWYMKNPQFLGKYIERYNGKIEIDHILRAWEIYIQGTEEVANG